MSRLHAACRFIERYNNKLRQAAKKDETRRMKAFVNNAYACDPRVLRRKAEEKAERYGRTHVIAAGSGSPWRFARPSMRLHLPICFAAWLECCNVFFRDCYTS